MIISDRFMFACEYLKNQLIIDAPYDTGNLAMNGIKIQQIDGKYHIVIGAELVQYAIYTNEPWLNRPGVNPNEGWVERSIENAKPRIKAIMSGRISQEEYDRDIAAQQNLIKQKLELHIEIKRKEQAKLEARRGQA